MMYWPAAAAPPLVSDPTVCHRHCSCSQHCLAGSSVPLQMERKGERGLRHHRHCIACNLPKWWINCTLVIPALSSRAGRWSIWQKFIVWPKENVYCLMWSDRVYVAKNDLQQHFTLEDEPGHAAKEPWSSVANVATFHLATFGNFPTPLQDPNLFMRQMHNVQRNVFWCRGFHHKFGTFLFLNTTSDKSSDYCQCCWRRCFYLEDHQ